MVEIGRLAIYIDGVFLHRIDCQRTLTTAGYVQGKDIAQTQGMRNPCVPNTDTPCPRYTTSMMLFDPLATP
ncbi:hypothetical protein D3C81_1035580 [compost metagenome]